MFKYMNCEQDTFLPFLLPSFLSSSILPSFISLFLPSFLFILASVSCVYCLCCELFACFVSDEWKCHSSIGSTKCVSSLLLWLTQPNQTRLPPSARCHNPDLSMKMKTHSDTFRHLRILENKKGRLTLLNHLSSSIILVLKCQLGVSVEQLRADTEPDDGGGGGSDWTTVICAALSTSITIYCR